MAFYTETTTETTRVYAVNDIVQVTGSNDFYTCSAINTIGLLLTDTLYFIQSTEDTGKLNTQYETYFNELVTEYTKAGSEYALTKADFLEELETFGLTPEQKAEAFLQFKQGGLQLVYGQANTATLAILKEEKAHQVKDREIQSYDDNLLLKVTEMQGSVASFFVNSAPESTGAQAVLDDLKAMMQEISTRANNIDGTQVAIPAV